MNADLQSWLALAIVAATVVLLSRAWWRRRRRGCGGSCAGQGGDRFKAGLRR